MPLNETFLRGIRDRAQWAEEESAEFVAFDERGALLTTLSANADVRDPIVKDLRKAIADKALPGLGGPEMNAENLRLGGRNYLVLYATRFPTNSRFFLLYPRAGIEAAKRRALERIALFGALGLLLAAILARLVAGWISRPVRRLASTADRLAAGGLGEPLEEDLEAARDEIGRLASAFRQMVESLRRSQEKLVKHERLAATGKLAATVAHEIRNPLTSLRMTVQMLAQKPADDATREAHAVVLSEIDRLALTVEELLTFASPRAPQREPVDLNRVVRDATAFLARQFQHAHVESVLDCDESLPQLQLDPNKLRQLLYNLLLNGLQAIVRSGRVTVRTKWDAARKRARLEVTDTGPGIPDEVRARVFDPFVSSKPGGGGLGLAIAKQIVEEHGGTIGFDSSKDGTVFHAELPAE
jgi:signal transduction histidine kinase